MAQAAPRLTSPRAARPRRLRGRIGPSLSEIAVVTDWRAWDPPGFGRPKLAAPRSPEGPTGGIRRAEHQTVPAAAVLAGTFRRGLASNKRDSSIRRTSNGCHYRRIGRYWPRDGYC